MAQMSTSIQAWNPAKVLDLDLKDPFQCIGTNKFEKRCNLDVLSTEILTAQTLLHEIAQNEPSLINDHQTTLVELARYLLCKDFHRRQAENIVINRWLPRVSEFASDRQEKEELRDQVKQLQEQLENLKRQYVFHDHEKQSPDRSTNDKVEQLNRDHDELRERQDKATIEQADIEGEPNESEDPTLHLGHDLGSCSLAPPPGPPGSPSPQLTSHTPPKSETPRQTERNTVQNELENSRNDLARMRRQITEKDQALEKQDAEYKAQIAKLHDKIEQLDDEIRSLQIEGSK